MDRVDTGSNPVDGLSRGDMKGPWRLTHIEVPPELLRMIETYMHGFQWKA